jgi:hypothetical protein
MMFGNTSTMNLQRHWRYCIYDMKKFPREQLSFQYRRGQQYSTLHYFL